MEEKNLTGYPSIDKPWLKYYSNETISFDEPRGSLYDYMHTCNIERMNETAITYMGRKITHSEFDYRIKACAAALISHDVKQGDIISACVLAIPEALILLYAANCIGAIVSFLIFNAPETDIHKQIIEADSKIVFSVSLSLEKIIKASKGTNIKEIVNIPISSSMPFVYRFAEILKQDRDLWSQCISWSDFITSGKEAKFINADKDDAAVIVYTGGTTGESKGVILSNKNINAATANYVNSKDIFDFKYGDRFLSIGPPFLSVGLITCMIMPLCARLNVVLCPDPKPEQTPKYVRRYKPNHFCVSPMHIDALLNDTKIQKMNLSFVKTAAYGGDKADPHWEDNASKFFTAHNMKYGLINGYGMTEAGASFCTTTHKTDFMIPFAKNNIMIIDLDSEKELGYGCSGQICICGPSIMKGYYKRKEETSQTMFVRDGITWLKTGDIGEISSEGAVTITGRLKRIMYCVGDGGAVFRVYPMRIEEVICSCNEVFRCGVVGRKDKDNGYIPIAYVALKNTNVDKERIRSKILAVCESQLSKTSVPHEIIFLDKLPTTSANKIDFKALEIIK